MMRLGAAGGSVILQHSPDVVMDEGSGFSLQSSVAHGLALSRQVLAQEPES